MMPFIWLPSKAVIINHNVWIKLKVSVVTLITHIITLSQNLNTTFVDYADNQRFNEYKCKHCVTCHRVPF